MKTTILLPTLLAAWVAVVGAEQATPPALPPTNQSAGRLATDPSRNSRVTSLRMTGVLEAFDEHTGKLTVRTKTDLEHLSLTPMTRLRRGWHRLDPSTLAQYVGTKVIVRYSDLAADQIVLSLRVTDVNREHNETDGH